MASPRARNCSPSASPNGLWAPLPASDAAIPLKVTINAIKATGDELHRMQLAVRMIAGGRHPPWGATRCVRHVILRTLDAAESCGCWASSQSRRAGGASLLLAAIGAARSEEPESARSWSPSGSVIRNPVRQRQQTRDLADNRPHPEGGSDDLLTDAEITALAG